MFIVEFLYTNADNLINKLDELKARIVKINPDICIITEVYPKTGDSTDIFPSELCINGYDCFRSNVLKSSRGVVIYVKDYMWVEIRDDLTSFNYLESVWVDIYINKRENFIWWNL